jgi:hypothetical protein
MGMTEFITRPYNQIRVEGNKVIKKGPKDKITRELAWFKEAKHHIPQNIPTCKVISEDSYEMNKIEGSNLYQWILKQRDQEKINVVLKKLFDLANKIHAKRQRPNKEDIRQMYLEKPSIALKEFLDNDAIDADNLVINNKKRRNPLKLLKEQYRLLEKDLLETEYSFIHGDLTWSNTLIDNDLNLFLIDPRGCFGSTELYGDIRYDKAKMYYSIVGNFDSLNAGKFTYEQNNNKHTYTIESTPYDKKILSLLLEKDEKIIKFIHSTIWLSLIPHIGDVRQRYAAFCHGITLMEQR